MTAAGLGIRDSEEQRTAPSRIPNPASRNKQYAGANRQRIEQSERHRMSNQGKIVQIIGAVVDVEFPRESVPKVYDALKVQDTAVTLEVQQQLGDGVVRTIALRSEEHTSELQSLMRISYAVFCLKKKNNTPN